MNESMSKKAVYRTAPATPGLLKINSPQKTSLEVGKKYIKFQMRPLKTVQFKPPPPTNFFLDISQKQFSNHKTLNEISLWYQCQYSHRSRDMVSPVCRIFNARCAGRHTNRLKFVLTHMRFLALFSQCRTFESINRPISRLKLSQYLGQICCLGSQATVGRVDTTNTTCALSQWAVKHLEESLVVFIFHCRLQNMKKKS